MTAIRLQAVRYSCVGVVNTLAGLGVIYAAKWFAGVADPVANAIGYAVGISIGFAANRQWTFRDNGRFSSALPRYVVAVGLGYLLNLAAVLFLIEFLAVDSYVAQGLGIVPYIVFVFLASRYFVFRSSAAQR